MSKKAKLAAVHIGKKRLNLDEETYRSKLELVTGKRSAGEMNDRELDAVLDAFRAEGFTRPRARARVSANPAHAFMRAMWISLYHLGAVSDRRDTALDAFVKRQTGVESAGWLGPEDSFKVVEALKIMCAREGLELSPIRDGGLSNKRALVIALLQKINPETARLELKSNAIFEKEGKALDAWAARLGQLLRSARK